MTRRAMMAMIAAASVLAGGPAAGQTPREQMNERYATLIEMRLAAAQPLQLSAETMTLSGDELRLVRHATFQFDGTTIQADEAILHRDTKQVELRGKVAASLSAAAARQLGLTAPRIEYR